MSRINTSWRVQSEREMRINKAREMKGNEGSGRRRWRWRTGAEGAKEMGLDEKKEKSCLPSLFLLYE